MERQEILRGIPKVDELMQQEAILALREELPTAAVRAAVREELDGLRQAILAGDVCVLPEEASLCETICRRAREDALPSLRPVINGTGVVLHTNLGRACLSQRAADAVTAVARGYSTLEYDLAKGQRGSRHDHIETLVCQVTGAEAAMVVNNNAAAVLLILSALGKGGEVITSRGELVEIGGSFRIPEIMVQCGCTLREVGATNKTHLRDYENAIGPETRALLKVHTSNFKIMGFSQSVPLDELVALGREKGLPVIEDLGSGSLVDLEQFGIHDEPTVQQSVKAGVDIISFSGDKLLGGPQAGILVGRVQWLEPLKRHPLTRALRVDKLTLAALEATLEAYRDPRRAADEIPALRMLTVPPDTLRRRAEALAELLAGLPAEIVETEEPAGGGSLPDTALPGFAVAIAPAACSAAELARSLRAAERPIIVHVQRERCLLHLRTLWDEDFAYLARTIRGVLL